MKYVLIATYLMVSISIFCQSRYINPFTLILLKPDTAIIDQKLLKDADSIVVKHQNQYYDRIKWMENLLNFKDYSQDLEQEMKESKLTLQKEFDLLKLKEPDVKHFKYFHELSAYAFDIYDLMFNDNDTIVKIVEQPHQNTNLRALAQLAHTKQADYIVFFDNMHSVMVNKEPLLKVKTSLYAQKERKIIFSQEITANSYQDEGMWECDSSLLCLIMNAAKNSTENIIPLLAKLQIKKP